MYLYPILILIGEGLFTLPPINSILDGFEVFHRDLIVFKIFPEICLLPGYEIHETRILEVGGVLSSSIAIRLSITTLFFNCRKVMEISLPYMLKDRYGGRRIDTTNPNIHALKIECLIVKVRKGDVVRETMKKEMIENE